MDISTDAMAQRSRVLYSDHDFALGACGDMFFVLWKDRTTHEGISVLRDQFDKFAAGRAKELALITIVTNCAAKGPPAEVRDDLAEWLGKASEKLVISAVVFEGDGFVAAMVRAIATGLTLLAQPNCPHRVVGTVDQAGHWFQTATSRGPRIFKQQYVVSRVSEFRNAANARRSIGANISRRDTP